MHPLIQPTLHHAAQLFHSHYDTQLTSPRPVPLPHIPFWQFREWQDPDTSSDRSDEGRFPGIIDDEHWTTEMVPERTFCIHGWVTKQCMNTHALMGIIINSVSYMDSLHLHFYYEDAWSPVMMRILPGLKKCTKLWFVWTLFFTYVVPFFWYVHIHFLI